MIEMLSNSLHRYFTRLSNVGYMKQKDVDILLVYTFMVRMLLYDFHGLVSERDYNEIRKALYCLYGRNCLIDFPDYCSGKDRRVMYLGSMSELVHRVDKLEKKNGGSSECECPLVNKEIVLPKQDGDQYAGGAVDLSKYGYIEIVYGEENTPSANA